MRAGRGHLDVLLAYSKIGGEQKLVTGHRNLGIIGRWVDIGGEMARAAGELHLE